MKRAGLAGLILGLVLGGIPVWTFASSQPGADDVPGGASTAAALDEEVSRFSSPRVLDA